MHAERSGDCCEGTARGSSGEGSERKEETKSLHLLREYINNHEQNVGRHMDGKGHSVEVSDGNIGHVIEQWRKGNSCYKVGKELA